jgi:hypothetical protein
VASNPRAGTLRDRLAQSDPAAEVRGRAKRAVGQREERACPVDSPRFAAALRALESGGVLAPDVAAALAASLGDEASCIDEEGAVRAAQVLPSKRMMELLVPVASLGRENIAACGFAAGLALRRAPSAAVLGEMVVEAAKILSQVPAHVRGVLTGKARLAAWLSVGLASSDVLAAGEMGQHLNDHCVAADSLVLRRGMQADPARVVALCEACLASGAVPPAVLELAWLHAAIDDEQITHLAKHVVRVKPRGRDVQEDEIDLDPSCRSLPVLEKVVLAASRKITFSPRCALAVVALDARRVRYVMTAMPQWKGRLSGAMLSRVLRQNAGALSAARSESRQRQAEVRSWTERVLSDVELSLALGVGHITASEAVNRISVGRHRIGDGESLACGADVRAVIEGRQSIRPVTRWAADQRQQDAAALATWLLIEGHDRPRSASMIAAAIDSFASRHPRVPDGVSHALALVERRRPGRLEEVFPQTPRGKATLANAIARAYRGVGGLALDG